MDSRKKLGFREQLAAALGQEVPKPPWKEPKEGDLTELALSNGDLVKPGDRIRFHDLDQDGKMIGEATIARITSEGEIITAEYIDEIHQGGLLLIPFDLQKRNIIIKKVK
jgi:hypothetical protein